MIIDLPFDAVVRARRERGVPSVRELDSVESRWAEDILLVRTGPADQTRLRAEVVIDATRATRRRAARPPSLAADFSRLTSTA